MVQGTNNNNVPSVSASNFIGPMNQPTPSQSKGMSFANVWASFKAFGALLFAPIAFVAKLITSCCGTSRKTSNVAQETVFQPVDRNKNPQGKPMPSLVSQQRPTTTVVSEVKPSNTNVVVPESNSQSTVEAKKETEDKSQVRTSAKQVAYQAQKEQKKVEAQKFEEEYKQSFSGRTEAVLSAGHKSETSEQAQAYVEQVRTNTEAQDGLTDADRSKVVKMLTKFANGMKEAEQRDLFARIDATNDLVESIIDPSKHAFKKVFKNAVYDFGSTQTKSTDEEDMPERVLSSTPKGEGFKFVSLSHQEATKNLEQAKQLPNHGERAVFIEAIKANAGKDTMSAELRQELVQRIRDLDVVESSIEDGETLCGGDPAVQKEFFKLVKERLSPEDAKQVIDVLTLKYAATTPQAMVVKAKAAQAEEAKKRTDAEAWLENEAKKDVAEFEAAEKAKVAEQKALSDQAKAEERAVVSNQTDKEKAVGLRAKALSDQAIAAEKAAAENVKAKQQASLPKVQQMLGREAVSEFLNNDMSISYEEQYRIGQEVDQAVTAKTSANEDRMEAQKQAQAKAQVERQAAQAKAQVERKAMEARLQKAGL